MSDYNDDDLNRLQSMAEEMGWRDDVPLLDNILLSVKGNRRDFDVGFTAVEQMLGSLIDENPDRESAILGMVTAIIGVVDSQYGEDGDLFESMLTSGVVLASITAKPGAEAVLMKIINLNVDERMAFLRKKMDEADTTADEVIRDLTSR